MPGLTMPTLDETPLAPVLMVIRKSKDAVCKTDPRPSAWLSKARGTSQALDEAYSCAACRRCSVRTLCAAWAFQMEEFWVWAGFTAPQRQALNKKHPQLVGDLVMIVQALVNLSNGRGGRLASGQTADVPDDLAQMYVRRGLAVNPSAPELVDAANEIMDELDVASEDTRRPRQGTAATVDESDDEPDDGTAEDAVADEAPTKTQSLKDFVNRWNSTAGNASE